MNVSEIKERWLSPNTGRDFNFVIIYAKKDILELVSEVERLYEEADRLEKVSQALLLAAEKEPQAAVEALVQAIRERRNEFG